jgi:two-component system, response regulator
MADNGILLVEDNPADVELALRALRKNGMAANVEVVRDGVEALDRVFQRGAYAGYTDEQLPKVILLDLKLPLVDGLEVLQQVKADRRTRQIPVVVLTSSHEERDIVNSYDLGANSYIVKPVSFDQYAQAVQQLGVYWLTLNIPPQS